VVTFPGDYHMVINSGFNNSGGLNFSVDQWIRKYVKKERRCTCALKPTPEKDVRGVSSRRLSGSRKIRGRREESEITSLSDRTFLTFSIHLLSNFAIPPLTFLNSLFEQHTVN
jgi:hypothetical protein